MAMRGAGHIPKRAGKVFVRNLIWGLVAYAPIAAVLTLLAAAPLDGVLTFGGIFLCLFFREDLTSYEDVSAALGLPVGSTEAP
jgi:hypothetical protein